jgi:outer membrane protein TolC
VLRSEILQALVAGALAQRIVEIGAEDVAWLESIERAADVRYRSGQGSLGDTLEIQNEAAKRKNALETDRLQLEHERFTLNRLLNRAPHAAFPPVALPAAAPAIPLSARLLALARDNEPMLKVLDHRIEKAEAGARLSRNMRLPDVSLAVEGRQYSGDGELRSGMFSVRVSLPWINREKYRKDYARDQAELKAAELDRDDRVLEIREHLHHFATEIEAARREAILESGDIRVRSSQLLNSRLSEWQAGKGAFRDVLDARRMLLDSEVNTARAIAEQYQMFAEMLLWTGLDNLESLFALSSEPPLAHENKHEMGDSK